MLSCMLSHQFEQHGRVLHYIYKQIWWGLAGDILTMEQNEDSTHVRFTISLLSHWPQSSRVLCVLLHLPSFVTFPVNKSMLKA